MYYCHPRSPGERGSNEKQNQLIRWFFPKGTDFTTIQNRKIQQATDWINNYPRLLLGWHTSGELFSVFEKSVA
jgi:IS30 family transposase